MVKAILAEKQPEIKKFPSSILELRLRLTNLSCERPNFILFKIAKVAMALSVVLEKKRQHTHTHRVQSVSYTHLDVYKRQVPELTSDS